MISEDDSSSIEAALRESEEELGLRTDNVEIWGRMLPIPDRVIRASVYYLIHVFRCNCAHALTCRANTGQNILTSSYFGEEKTATYIFDL